MRYVSTYMLGIITYGKREKKSQKTKKEIRNETHVFFSCHIKETSTSFQRLLPFSQKIYYVDVYAIQVAFVTYCMGFSSVEITIYVKIGFLQ